MPVAARLEVCSDSCWLAALDCHLHTASQAQCQYLVESVPAGAKVFVFAGGNAHSVDGSFWMEQLRRQDDELVSSWEVIANDCA